jgi:hypothetical protein
MVLSLLKSKSALHFGLMPNDLFGSLLEAKPRPILHLAGETLQLARLPPGPRRPARPSRERLNGLRLLSRNAGEDMTGTSTPACPGEIRAAKENRP